MVEDELVESKNKVMELEANQVTEGNERRHVTASLSCSCEFCQAMTWFVF